MRQRKFRWGIIGIGHIAGKFAHDLALEKHAELYAVASRSQQRAQRFADKFGATHAFGSYAEILNADIDAVYIATRHPQHCEATLLCLNAEIPVLCEKPLAMNSAEVAKMVSASRENSVFLMEAIWTRFLPSTIKVKEIIDAGEIGDVLTVKADFGFTSSLGPESRLFNPALGGGALLDIGIYPLFIAQLLLGKPQSMQATAFFGETGVDEETAINLRYANNQFALLHATMRSHTESTALIYGTKGSIKIHSRWHESNYFVVSLNNGEKRTYKFDFAGAFGYRFEIQHVMQCVKRGKKESDLLPLSFSEDLMATMDAVRKEIGLEY